MIKITNDKEYLQIRKELLQTQLSLIDLVHNPKEADKINPILKKSYKDVLVDEANRMMDLLLAYENKVGFTPKFIQDSAKDISQMFGKFPQKGAQPLDIEQAISQKIKERYQNYIPEIPDILYTE